MKLFLQIEPSDSILETDEDVECLLTIEGKKVGHILYLIEYEIPFSTKKHVLYFECNFKVSFIDIIIIFSLVLVVIISICKQTVFSAINNIS